MVRELGPVLTGLMVAGRNSSGMASELGSMKVTEQIDAMRAMGVDPTKKLVTPTGDRHRRHAVLSQHHLRPGRPRRRLRHFVSAAGTRTPTSTGRTAYQSLRFADVFMGLCKPVVFGFIIATIGCYYGMSAKGGTQGVGRATTQAVVAASVLIVVSDFFITKLLMGIFGK